MKKLLLSFLLSCIILVSRSQPTITSANQYAIGDVTTSQTASTVPSEGPAGANQTWNFSTLTAYGGVTTSNIVAPSSTPYASTFPSANIAADNGSGAYSYLQNTSTETNLVGVAASATLLYPYSDFQKYFVYPFTYNTSFTDNVSASWVLNTVPTDRSGTVSFKADGYGTLMLPSGTVNNVLRVKYVQNVTDVATIYYFTFTSTYHFTSYSWYAPGTKDALLTISYDTTELNGYSTITSSASYLPSNVAAPLLLSSAQVVNALPNPSTDHSTISFTTEQEGDMLFSLLNINGQTVRSWTETSLVAGVHFEEITLGDLETGTYFIRLEMVNRKPVVVQLVKE